MKHAFIKGFLSSWTVNNRFLNFDQIKISELISEINNQLNYLFNVQV